MGHENALAQQARRAYDRIGALQDTQAVYEGRVTKELVSTMRLSAARSVFEFGCGTGRFAAHLLADHLPASATQGHQTFALASSTE